MKKLSRNLNLKSNKNAYAVAVAIALILASALLISFYAFERPIQKGYMTVYLLDSQRKTVDFPEYVVADVNSTFSVFVHVENHLGKTLNYTQVQVKSTTDSNPTFPLDANVTQTLEGGVLKDGASVENVSTVSLNQPGNYLVVFELWIPNSNGAPQYSGDFTALNVQVAAPENATTPTAPT